MKYIKYIVLVALLILLCCSIYLIKYNAQFRGYMGLGESVSKISEIPKLEIEKEIEFSIVKNRYKNLLFSGKFSNPETPKEIAELFDKEIVYKVVIDTSLKVNREVVEFTKKIIGKLNNHLSEWSIVYRDGKLLVEGKTTDGKAKRSIDIILAISNLNYFNNIEVIENSELEVLQTLRDVLPKDNITRENH